MSGAKLLLGRGGPRVQLPASIVRSSTKATPTNAAAGFRLHTDGTIDATPNGSTNLNYSDDLGSWLLRGAASEFEAKVDNASPDAFSGDPENSWQDLGTVVSDWFAQVTSDAGGVQDCNSTLRIRDKTTLEELATCAVGMYAEVVI